MTPKEFVELFHNEKTDYFNLCFDEKSGIEASETIKSLNLSAEQKEVLKKLIDIVLTDTYYTILLGLDGCANIGGFQRSYKIYDEDGDLLTNCGEIEAETWEYFHNQK